MVPNLNKRTKKKLLIIHILSMSNFKVAILILDVEDKTQVHNFNEFENVFQYYYPMDLI